MAVQTLFWVKTENTPACDFVLANPSSAPYPSIVLVARAKKGLLECYRRNLAHGVSISHF